MLATGVEVTVQTISGFETGATSRIQPRAWEKIASLFEMTVEQLNAEVFGSTGSLGAQITAANEQELREAFESLTPAQRQYLTRLLAEAEPRTRRAAKTIPTSPGRRADGK